MPLTLKFHWLKSSNLLIIIILFEYTYWNTKIKFNYCDFAIKCVTPLRCCHLLYHILSKQGYIILFEG